MAHDVLDLGDYRVDVDRYGHIRARYLMKRTASPFPNFLVLDAKVKAKFPDAELLSIKRSKCDLKGELSWWVVKWNQRRVAFKVERVLLVDGERRNVFTGEDQTPQTKKEMTRQ